MSAVPAIVPAHRGDLVCVVSVSDVPSTTGPVVVQTSVRLTVVTNISRSGEVRGYREIDGTHIKRVGSATRGEQYLLVPASAVDVDAAAANYVARGTWFERSWTSQASRRDVQQGVTPAAIDAAREFIRPFRLVQADQTSA
ncbi:hypothetical protein [Gordonia aichiensis]|uniref:hypothetical protein n=1 Tax=Gordonia aichiensis TaxID=36820 RepID=UPI003263DAE6